MLWTYSDTADGAPDSRSGVLRVRTGPGRTIGSRALLTYVSRIEPVSACAPMSPACLKLIAVLWRAILLVLVMTWFVFIGAAAGAIESTPSESYINGAEGNDTSAGDKQHPLK